MSHRSKRDNSKEEKGTVNKQRTGIPGFIACPSIYQKIPSIRRGYDIQRLETDCESIDRFLENQGAKAIYSKLQNKKDSFKKFKGRAYVVPKGT